MQYIKIDGDTATVNVKGEMYTCIWAVLEEEINEAMVNCTKLKFDFSMTNTIDSCSMGEIVNLRQKYGANNVMLKNLHGMIKEQFVCSNLLSVFRVVD